MRTPVARAQEQASVVSPVFVATADEGQFKPLDLEALRAWSAARAIEPDVLACLIEFWWPLISDPGYLDLAQVMRELYDYRTVLREVSKVYDHLTNGKFSKPNTDAEYIIAAVEDAFSSTGE